jgi:hypothetical protein
MFEPHVACYLPTKELTRMGANSKTSGVPATQTSVSSVYSAVKNQFWLVKVMVDGKPALIPA